MNEAMNSPPFSQCDAKGRCLRHPTVQMSRKKKLGGWKKLLGNCPLCALELMDGERAAAAPPRGPSDCASLRSQGSARRRQKRAPRVGHHDDDRSVDTHADRSVLSAPSAYGRGGLPRGGPRDRPPSKRGSLVSSDSSCDTTVDLSYSSEYSGSSRRSGRSSGSRGRAPPPRHDRGRGAPSGHGHGEGVQDPRDQGEFVCGMELFVDEHTRCFYTGQIDAGTQLPHGLGTLRSEVDGSILEGSWEYGRLVQENGEASPPPGSLPGTPPGPRGYVEHEDQQDVSPMEYPEEYQPQDYREGNYPQEYQQECQEGENDYCHPCASPQDQHQDARRQDNYEESLRTDLQRCRVEDDESSYSNSIAETYEGDDAFDTGSDSSAAGSSASGYSARERKASLPPPPVRRNSRLTRDVPREYERHAEAFHGARDCRWDEHGRAASRGRPGRVERERVRRVRFQEDP